MGGPYESAQDAALAFLGYDLDEDIPDGVVTWLSYSTTDGGAGTDNLPNYPNFAYFKSTFHHSLLDASQWYTDLEGMSLADAADRARSDVRAALRAYGQRQQESQQEPGGTQGWDGHAFTFSGNAAFANAGNRPPTAGYNTGTMYLYDGGASNPVSTVNANANNGGLPYTEMPLTVVLPYEGTLPFDPDLYHYFIYRSSGDNSKTSWSYYVYALPNGHYELTYKTNVNMPSVGDYIYGFTCDADYYRFNLNNQSYALSGNVITLPSTSTAFAVHAPASETGPSSPSGYNGVFYDGGGGSATPTPDPDPTPAPDPEPTHDPVYDPPVDLPDPYTYYNPDVRVTDPSTGDVVYDVDLSAEVDLSPVTERQDVMIRVLDQIGIDLYDFEMLVDDHFNTLFWWLRLIYDSLQGLDRSTQDLVDTSIMEHTLSDILDELEDWPSPASPSVELDLTTLENELEDFHIDFNSFWDELMGKLDDIIYDLEHLTVDNRRTFDPRDPPDLPLPDPETGIVPWEDVLNITALRDALTRLMTKFPFATINDIALLFTALVRPAVAPEFDLPMPNPSDWSDPYLVHIDLSDWDVPASVLRLGITLWATARVTRRTMNLWLREEGGGDA